MNEGLLARWPSKIEGFRSTFNRQGLTELEYCLELVWAGNTSAVDDMKPTVMFTCAKKDMGDINRIARHSPLVLLTVSSNSVN
jgi:hypothetical protein